MVKSSSCLWPQVGLNCFSKRRVRCSLFFPSALCRSTVQVLQTSSLTYCKLLCNSSCSAGNSCFWGNCLQAILFCLEFYILFVTQLPFYHLNLKGKKCCLLSVNSLFKNRAVFRECWYVLFLLMWRYRIPVPVSETIFITFIAKCTEPIYLYSEVVLCWLHESGFYLCSIV